MSMFSFYHFLILVINTTTLITYSPLYVTIKYTNFFTVMKEVNNFDKLLFGKIRTEFKYKS